jgi:membrane protein DedA with SNARE-associated domain
MELTQYVRDALTALPAPAVYLAVGVLLIAETGLLVGLALPAGPVLLLVGGLAAAGRLELTYALAVTTLAALLGDWLAYLSGRRVAAAGPARVRWAGRLVGAHRWSRADRLMVRYGGAAVLVGRWIAVVRTLMPRLAGAARLEPLRFAAWNFAGVIVWVPGSVLVGYLAGESYERQSAITSRTTLVVVVVVVLAAALALIFTSRRRRPLWRLRGVGGAARGEADPGPVDRELHPVHVPGFRHHACDVRLDRGHADVQAGGDLAVR